MKTAISSAAHSRCAASQPACSGRHHHDLGDEHLSGFSEGPLFAESRSTATASCASRRNSKLFSPPASPPSGAWRRPRMAPIYAGTGHRGRVYHVTASGASTLVWTADEPEVFALALDPAGVLYAASSPDGKVYRIEKGKAAEFFAPKSEIHLVAGVRPRRQPVRRHRRSRQCLSRGQSRKIGAVLRNRPIARHRAGVRFPRQCAGRHRTQRHPLSHRAPRTRLSCCTTPACRRSATIVPHAGRHRVRRGSGRLDRESLGTAYCRPLRSPMSITVTAPATSITVHRHSERKPAAISSPKPDAPEARRASRCSSTPPHQPADGNPGRREIRGLQNQSGRAQWKRCGARRKRTCTACWWSRTARSSSPPTRKAASTGWARIAKPRCWWKPTKAKQRGCCDAPNGLLAATGDMGKLFRLAGAEGATRQLTNRRCTTPAPWRAGAASLGAVQRGKVELLHALGKFRASG